MNYFELFDLPVAPVVDTKLLSAKFFELQRKNHPDFFTQATELEKESSLQRSADINKAFAVFQNKEKTIEYFLKLSGLITENEKYNLPPGFLMEMMEINEALTEEGAASVSKKIDDYNCRLNDDIKYITGGSNINEIKEADLLKLKEYYYKKKYLNRILDRLGD